ncbi:Jag family protein [Catelliglobosispora koreensis]|uniref:Jag family protein n=1 Tax=Catelliglobosispora koreensis TaxID=129052 RepID=UPI0003687B8E|nr:R3H domain-containing nucleic acid-binding protein [Catelliglobosispora koreensis]
MTEQTERLDIEELDDTVDAADVEEAQDVEAQDAEESSDSEESEEDAPKRKALSDADLFRQSEVAADYIEGLLDILDADGDIDELVSNGRPVVEVVGAKLQSLIGQRGATLEALQELTRLAIFKQTGEPSRLLLDVGGYRDQRRKELGLVAQKAVEKVKQNGEAVRLEPMSAFERKCVHDVVNASYGVASESEGVEPNRRIVVRPA